MKDLDARRLLLAVLLAAVFATGLWRLFQLRFEAGDVYPPYSSLRSDPLGTRLLYAGLERFDHLQVDRWYLPLTRLDGDRHTVLFFPGVAPDAMERSPAPAVKALERFVLSGGRLILSLRMSGRRHSDASHEANTEEAAENEGKDGREPPGDVSDEDTEPPFARMKDDRLSLSRRWGLSVVPVPLPLQTDATARCVAPDGTPLPGHLPWPTGYELQALDDAWHPLFERNEKTVVMQRRYGRGEMVLLADSFVLSNEAVRDRRPTTFLAWLVGDRTTVLFEETHLGIARSQGIASLGRKYRLHGLLLSLLALALLFVWKNSAPLLPATPPGREPETAPPPEADAGLVSLLRRHIDKKNVVAVCLSEWHKGEGRDRIAARDSPIPADRLEEAASGDPLTAHGRITAMLTSQRKPK